MDQTRYPVTLATLLLGACAALASDAPSGQLNADHIKKLDAAIARQIERKNLPGVIVAINIPGEGRYTALQGKANLQTGRVPELNDPFRIASITKMFTATAALRLIDEGKVRGDDTVSRWFPDFPNAGKITIEQLLTMRSGIADPVDHEMMKEFYRHPLVNIGLDGLLKKASSNAAKFTPAGEKTKYTDFNYILLGEIVSRVSGKELARQLAESVFRPLGLKNTACAVTSEFSSGLRGYGWDSSSKKFEDKTDLDARTAGGAGAIVSTVADLEVFLRAAYKGNLLRPETQKMRLECRPIEGAPKFIQYGAGIGRFGCFYGHNGGIPGFSSEAFYLPEKDATIVICVNRNDENELSHADGLFFTLMKIAFPQYVDW